jgi:hypothetical protein
MPTSPPIYADELLATLALKRFGDGYQQLLAFVEACESGSIFQGMLVDSLGIFATTAANALESSWGTYCPRALLKTPKATPKATSQCSLHATRSTVLARCAP